MKPETGLIVVALAAMLISTGTSLVGPVMIGRGVDTYVRLKDSHGLLVTSLLLMAVYLVGVVFSYTQIRTMGGVGRRVLFSLRNALFMKLQDLPVAFFNENKAGDLISRVNNDTDKLNQFVGQALMQFLSSLFLMTGAAVFALSLNFRLGIAALLPAVGVFAATKATSAWVKARNMKSLQSLGGMSSEIQESLQNFKVNLAFHRMDYFQQKFETANEANYAASVSRVRCAEQAIRRTDNSKCHRPMTAKNLYRKWSSSFGVAANILGQLARIAATGKWPPPCGRG